MGSSDAFAWVVLRAWQMLALNLNPQMASGWLMMTVLSRGIFRIEPTAMYAARQMGVLKGDDKGC